VKHAGARARHGRAARRRRAPDGASAAILVPLVYRGETLGVLAGLDRADGQGFDRTDEQLLLSVAASAATAVATARSVAGSICGSAWRRPSRHARAGARSCTTRRCRASPRAHDAGRRPRPCRAGCAAPRRRDRGRAPERGDAQPARPDHRAAPGRAGRPRPGPAIESLTHRQCAAGGSRPPCGWTSPGRTGSPELEGAVYRIVQEALSNVVRHAGAERVTLGVRQAEGPHRDRRRRRRARL